MLYYVLHGMTTGAKFPRSELVAFVRNRATETAFTSPTGRLTSSQFKLSVFISANLLLILCSSYENIKPSCMKIDSKFSSN